MVAQPCGLTGTFRKIVYSIAETAPNDIQEGKQRPQQGDCPGQIVRQHVQGKFAFDRLEPTAPEAVKPLLGTQAAEHRFDDRLALAENASRLAEVKRRKSLREILKKRPVSA